MISKNPNLTELNWLKRQARNKGAKGEVLTQVSPYYKAGHYTELAVMAILGATQSYQRSKGINMKLDATAELDRWGVDVRIDTYDVQIKSRFSYQSYMEFNPDLCYVEYDAVGMINLMTILEFIDYPETYFDDEFMAKVNRLWNHYMHKYVI